jgi:hypothetical protein
MEIKRTKGITSKRIDDGTVYKINKDKTRIHPIFPVLDQLKAGKSFWEQKLDCHNALGFYKTSGGNIFLINKDSVYALDLEITDKLYPGDKNNWENKLVKQVPALQGAQLLAAYTALDKAW